MIIIGYSLGSKQSFTIYQIDITFPFDSYKRKRARKKIRANRSKTIAFPKMFGSAVEEN